LARTAKFPRKRIFLITAQAHQLSAGFPRTTALLCIAPDPRAPQRPAARRLPINTTTWQAGLADEATTPAYCWCAGAQTFPADSRNVADAAFRATQMSKIVLRVFQPTPARLEMRALGLRPRIPVGGAVLFLFGCGQVAIAAATLAAL
jgi:hypothetical protein